MEEWWFGLVTESLTLVSVTVLHLFSSTSWNIGMFSTPNTTSFCLLQGHSILACTRNPFMHAELHVHVPLPPLCTNAELLLQIPPAPDRNAACTPPWSDSEKGFPKSPAKGLSVAFNLRKAGVHVWDHRVWWHCSAPCSRLLDVGFDSQKPQWWSWECAFTHLDSASNDGRKTPVSNFFTSFHPCLHLYLYLFFP